MNAPKRGDRVRVTFEGEYLDDGAVDCGHRVFPIGESVTCWVHPNATFEVLAPPITLDTDVTVGVLDRLPDYSVVVEDSLGGVAVQKHDGKWGEADGGVAPKHIAHWPNSRIVYIGRES